MVWWTVMLVVGYLFLGMLTALFDVWFLADEYDGAVLATLVLGWPLAWVIWPLVVLVNCAEKFLYAVYQAKQERKPTERSWE